MTGLIAAREPLVVVAGGDMPSLDPAVLALLIRALVASSADAALLEHRGRRQQLPFAVRTGAGTDAARRLLAQGERRLGALTDRLTVRVLPEEEWRPLDPDARTLRDIDEPADLPGSGA
jgi:molybdopterin-guanine dinucleotide biosynthesis protein A